MDQQMEDMLESISKIFGKEATDKVMDIMSKQYMRIDDLMKSRDKWKQKYVDCTFKKRKI